MTDLIEFDTDRLRLRQWCAEDRAPLAQLNADPRVMEFFPSILDRATSDAMVDRLQAGIIDRGWGFWAREHCLYRLSMEKWQFDRLPIVSYSA